MALYLEKDLKFTCQRGCQKGCDYCKVVEGLFEIRWCSNPRCGRVVWHITLGELSGLWGTGGVFCIFPCISYRLSAVFCIHLVHLIDITVHKLPGISFMLKFVPSLSVLLGQIHVVSVTCYNKQGNITKLYFWDFLWKAKDLLIYVTLF